MRTLLLDQNYIPIQIITWRVAITDLYKGKVEVVEEYDEIVRSPSMELRVPSVVRLKKSEHRRKGKVVRFSRQNVFWRDDFKCQYCTDRFPPKHLTLDHVTPKSIGGPKKFENIVTACKPCNAKKRDRTPEQAGMKLLRKPERPRWSPQFVVRVRNGDPDVWRNYVYWQTLLDFQKV